MNGYKRKLGLKDLPNNAENTTIQAQAFILLS